MKRQDVLEQSKFWFEKLEIGQWWNKKISELSKGMSQKVQFVVTVLHNPKLLILDEPFSGFDPVNANLIKNQILELKKNGTTIILSTHRMESVEELCDQVALVHQSKKIFEGEISKIKEKFRQNLLEISLAEIKEERFNQFKERMPLQNEQRKGEFVSFELKNDFNQRQLFQELTEIGKVQLFKEKMPTMNEVFISAVENNEKINQ